MPKRRSFLRTLPVFAGVGFGGCGGNGSNAKRDADVVAGGDSRLRFDPETLTISIGETVTWYFDSNSHNVSCVPDHHDAVSLPSGATPFSSYDDGNTHQTNARGSTYAHTFETPGTYQYVCIPHTPEMVGKVVVEA